MADQTSATFFRVVGSELNRKYPSDRLKFTWELVCILKGHAPFIIFVDETDAIGTKKYMTQILVLGEKFSEQ